MTIVAKKWPQSERSNTVEFLFGLYFLSALVCKLNRCSVCKSSYVFLILFFSNMSYSIDFGYFLSQDVFFSNNINQSVEGEEISGSGYVSGIGANLDVLDSTDLYIDMRTYYYVTQYSTDEIEREDNTFLNANLIYAPSNSHMSIALMDELTQVPADRFSVDDTKDLDVFNIAAIRPAYYLSFGRLDKLGFEYLYVNLNDINANNIGGDTSRINNRFSIDYLKTLSKLSSFSLVVSQGETIFDEESGIDYQQTDGFFRWYRSKKNTNIGFSLGRSRVKTEENTVFNEDYFEFTLTRRVNSKNSVNILMTSGFNTIVDPIFGDEIEPIRVGEQTVFFAQAVSQDQIKISYSISDRIYFNRLSYQYTIIDNPDFEAKETQHRLDYFFSYPISRMFNSDKIINFVFRAEGTSVAIKEADQQALIGRAQLGVEYSPRPNFLVTTALKSRRTKSINDDSKSDELSFFLGVKFSPDNLFQGI